MKQAKSQGPEFPSCKFHDQEFLNSAPWSINFWSTSISVLSCHCSTIYPNKEKREIKRRKSRISVVNCQLTNELPPQALRFHVERLRDEPFCAKNRGLATHSEVTGPRARILKELSAELGTQLGLLAVC